MPEELRCLLDRVALDLAPAIHEALPDELEVVVLHVGVERVLVALEEPQLRVLILRVWDALVRSCRPSRNSRR